MGETHRWVDPLLAPPTHGLPQNGTLNGYLCESVIHGVRESGRLGVFDGRIRAIPLQSWFLHGLECYVAARLQEWRPLALIWYSELVISVYLLESSPRWSGSTRHLWAFWRTFTNYSKCLMRIIDDENHGMRAASILEAYGAVSESHLPGVGSTKPTSAIDRFY